MTHKIFIKPRHLRFLGLIYNSAQVIYPYILIPESLDQRLKEEEKEAIAILEHEKVHFQRMKDQGVIKWYFKYVFNKNFRLQEEVIAYKKQIQILGDGNIDKYAKILSSWTYLRMVDEKIAKELLKEEF